MSFFATPFDDPSYRPPIRTNIPLEEQKILSSFNDYWTEAYAAKTLIKRMMEESYLSFRSILSDYSFMSRDIDRMGLAVFVPHTFQAVASIQAQLNGRPPQYRLKARFPGPKRRETAEAVSMLSRAEFDRSKAMAEFATAVQTSLIFGTAFLRSRFKYDKRKGKFLKEVKEDGSMEFVEEEKTLYSGWGLTNDHPLSVYLPPTHSAKPQDWPYYIHRELTDVRREYLFYKANPAVAYKTNWQYLCPWGDLRDDLEVLFKIDQSYELANLRYPGSVKDFFAHKQATQYAAHPANSKYLAEKFRVYDLVNDAWYVIIGGVIVEYHPNPLDTKELPVEAVRDYKVEFNPWGIGEPQLLRYLQHEANALHTLALDSTKFSTAGVYGVNSAMLKNPTDLSVYPGKVFDIKNMPNLNINSVIQQLNTGDVKSGTFRMIEENNIIIGKTLGTGSAVIGGDPLNATSATESNNLKAAATTRIYERSRVMEQENLVNVINMQIQFMGQFYDEELTTRISGTDDFIKFVPGEEKDYPAESKAMDMTDGYAAIVYTSDLTQGFDIQVEGESTLPISRSERRMEGMQLLKLATEARRPPTAEEIQKDPSITQRFPQGIPVLDPEVVAKRLVLPNFTVVDTVDDFVYNPEQSVGVSDRQRGVGRPANPVNPEAFAPFTESQQIQSAAQPNNMGVNEAERML